MLPALLLRFQAFTIMDQNRDGFIDKADLRDTFAALGEPSFGNLPSPTALSTSDLLTEKQGGGGAFNKPSAIHWISQKTS